MGNLHYSRILFLILVLLVGGCGELTPPGERSSGYSTGRATSYIVRRGDTLYSIAWDAGYDPRTVAAWNNIHPPYTIYPGQRIRLAPPTWVHSEHGRTRTSASVASRQSASESRTSSSKYHSGHSKYPTKNTRIKTSRSAIEKTRISPQFSSNTSWRWPTTGKIVERFDVSSGKKGIDIKGRRGQGVFSAAAGDVVYSGNGLLGYGNLVIIKHSEIYLSAYGHNSRLLVKEGDRVKAGQKIAEMGVSSKEGAILHFEIRKEGKPVDPLSYLPKRN